jgi:creatinine amidohydrolase/Fe(II)-dependent formamide hydrolase-like protein
LLHQLEKVRFQTAVVLSGHGGTIQERMVAKAVEDYEEEGGMRIHTVFPYPLVGMQETSSHATPVETAVLRALCPEAVDVSRFTPAKEYEIAYDLGPAYANRRKTWQITDVDVRTEPLDDIAREFLDTLVERVGELLKA